MTRSSRRLGILLAAAVLILASPAHAVLDLSWFTIDGGGATACAGGTLTLGGTVGQPDAGALAGGAYSLLGGFWLGGSGSSGIFSDEDAPGEHLIFRVSPGLPNPFCSATNVLLELPAPRFVRAQVFDQAGRLVRRLCEGTLPTGRHAVAWDGRSEDGCRVASGVYIMSVVAGDFSTKRSIVLIR